MTSALTKAAASALVAATVFAALPAQAGERWRDHRRPVVQNDAGALIAAGVLGIAAGAVISGIANQPRAAYAEPVYSEPAYREPVYREPLYREPPRQRVREQHVRRDYYPPAPVRYNEREHVQRYASFEPWTREWYRYCENRYRSFNPNSGTFTGYDGVQRFCVAE